MSVSTLTNKLTNDWIESQIYTCRSICHIKWSWINNERFLLKR